MIHTMTAPAAMSRFKGRRILIVEDEMLIAMVIGEALAALGCEVVGPASRVAKALPLAQNEALDAAILDVNVAREPIYPVADALDARGIPVAFLTGYGQGGLEAGYRGRPVLNKPFLAADLHRLLEVLLPSPAPSASGV